MELNYIIYYILKKLCECIISLYFRKVHIVGKNDIPKNGPVIFCCNHSNQFIDAFMIGSIVNSQVSFTIANSSFNKPVVGTLAKLVKAIPVKRPEDYKFKGSGKIEIVDNIVKGIETNFIEETKSISSGWSLMIKNIVIPVKNVISKDHLEISNFSLLKNETYEYFVIFLFLVCSQTR